MERLAALRDHLADHFLDPAAGRAAVAILLILLLYMLKLRREPVVVSSTLLWERLLKDRRTNRPLSRLRRSLLLLVQLLTALALVVALMRPCSTGSSVRGELAVVVVDASASMGATDVLPSRLEAGIARVAGVLDELPHETPVMVIEAGTRVRLRLPFTTDRRRLQDVLGSMRAGQGPARLREALGLARSTLEAAGAKDGARGRIFLVSDGATGSLDDVDGVASRLVWIRVGTSGENVGITGLDLRRSGGRASGHQVFVRVTSRMTRRWSGAVEVRVGEKLADARILDLEPGRDASVVFDDPVPGGGEIRVDLAGRDILDADDHAVATLPGPRRDRVYLLTEAPALERVLDLMAGDLSVERIDPAGLASVPASSLVVTRDPRILAIPGPHVLLLDPEGPLPAGLGSGAVVDGAAVTDADPINPINRYLSYDGVGVGRARVIAATGELVPVVEAGHGPLIVAGFHQGRRVAVVGFAFEDSDLVDRATFPILVANLLAWFLPDPGGERLIRTGGTIRLAVREGSRHALTRPDGSRDVLVERAGVVEDAGVDRVGFYRLEGPGSTAVFAANLLDEGETDVRPRSRLRVGAVEVDAGTRSIPATRELTGWVLLLVLVLLMAEWTIDHRRFQHG